MITMSNVGMSNERLDIPTFQITSSLSSKHVLQRDLNLAHVGARAIDPAEGLGSVAKVGISPIRVVREVERLEPELERVILDDPELLMG